MEMQRDVLSVFGEMALFEGTPFEMEVFSCKVGKSGT